MPSGVADFGSTIWLGGLFGLNALPDHYYIALCSDEPGELADGDVVTDLEPDPALGYSREYYQTGASYWDLNGSFLTNTQDIAWGGPTDDWGRVSHYALLDSTTSGNLYAWGEFSTPVYITVGYTMVIPAGGMIIELDSIQNSIVV